MADAALVYAVTAERTRRALDAMFDRLGLGAKVSGYRVVLFNDSVNKRENVQSVLVEAGLSEDAANLAMYSAHRTGRGVIGYFHKEEEAEALVSQIADVGEDLPSSLIVMCEQCEFYQGDAAA